MIKKSLLPSSVKWLAELFTPNMTTFLARVPSLWLHAFLALVFLTSFTAPNKQLCMRYLKNDFYTRFENNINFCFLNEGWIYCANILQLRTSKLTLKSYIIKSKCRSTIFSFGSKAVSIFPTKIHSLTLSSLFVVAAGKFRKFDTREGKLTYFYNVDNHVSVNFSHFISLSFIRNLIITLLKWVLICFLHLDLTHFFFISATLEIKSDFFTSFWVQGRS